MCLLCVGGVYLNRWPFLPGLQDNRAAYWWSLAALLPVIGLALWQSKESEQAPEARTDQVGNRVYGYSGGLLVALAVSLIYTTGAHMRVYSESHTLQVHTQDFELALWSLISHFVLAVTILSALNLIFLVALKTPEPRAVRRVLTGTLIFATLAFVLARFLDTAMSFDGWSAYGYAAALALALTLWGVSVVLPFLARRTVESSSAATRPSRGQILATWIAIVLLVALAMASRSMIGGEDWNGFVASTWALIFWIAMSLCVYRLRPARANHSAP